ncbi:MAG: hypothetical protein ACYC0F_14975 [Rhodanobacter sp.]
MTARPWLYAVSTAAVAAAAVLLISISTSFAAPAKKQAPDTPKYLGTFPHFDPTLTTQLPGDVDTAMKKQLEGKQEFARVQRLFDLWSWQAFLSLNWPMDSKGKFAPSISDTSFGPPMWTSWYESTNIFRENGSQPATCGKPHTTMALSLVRDTSLSVARDLKPFVVPEAFDKRRTRLLGNISAVGDRSPKTPAHDSTARPSNLNDIMQAFTAPLVDQNGNFVFYEIQIDPNEVGYICQNKLYNINGQVAFTHAQAKKGHIKPDEVKLDMPAGFDAKDNSGSWELKLAWRVLTAKDDASRYLSSQAIVPAVDGLCPDKSKAKNDQCAVTVGMVGMHIGHKSKSSPQWIWSTFEQVDNLSVDNVAHPTLKPSFFNPNCPACVTNQQPAQDSDGSWSTAIPAQVSRAIPIPADKVALNLQAQEVLRKANSPLGYYQLIDSQWPTDPGAAPTSPAKGLPGAIDNKSGGNPTPVFLTNVTMETYFQVGVQPACNQEENVPCPPGPWLSQNQAQDRNSDTTPVFGSESCMGCHSSAGLYTSKTQTSGQLRGDFSWLFSQKAQLDTSSGK